MMSITVTLFRFFYTVPDMHDKLQRFDYIKTLKNLDFGPQEMGGCSCRRRFDCT